MTSSDDMAVCPKCATEFEPRVGGRGGRSRFCPDCQTLRSRVATEVRNTRTRLVDVGEMVDLYGSQYVEDRVEVARRQENRCLRCQQQVNRLSLVRADDGTLEGVCKECRQ